MDEAKQDQLHDHIHKQITAAIPDQNDQWLDTAPHLRKGLKVDLRKQKDRLVAIIEDPLRAKFFQVGNLEYHFIMLLDGRRTINAIIKIMQEDRGYANFDSLSAKTICSWLATMNLMDTPGTNNSGRLCQAAQAKEKQKLMGLLNPVSFRVNLMSPDQTLRKITPFAQWFFTPLMLVAWIVVGGIAWSLVSADYDRFCRAATGILAAERWVWLLLVWVVLKIVHETAHGVACQKYGGDVPQAGLLFLLLAPLAFVDVTSSWRFSNRIQRMVVSAAGMFVELFVAFLAIIVWYYTQSQWISDLAYNVVVMAGVSTVLFNANPLIRFDGYYLLSDMLGVVNLYGKGQNWFGNRVRHFVFGFPLDHNVCSRSELRVVAIYGVCSFVWRIVLSVSLLLIASTLLDAAGLILALIGGVFWVCLPLLHNIKKIQTIRANHPVKRKRFALVATGTTLFVLCCFLWLQAPSISRAPAIVQFKDEEAIRANADGFVSEVLVVDGEHVQTGQLLMRIDNPELMLELESLQQAANTAKIQARIHRQRDELSLQQAELAKLESLIEQVAEKKVQVDGLQLTAPFDGVVFRRDLSNMVGSFVHQGDLLMHFADPNKKEILISIDQEQIKSVKSNVEASVRFAFSGIGMVRTKLQIIEPRASDIPLDPSMTAVAGGPLAVKHAMTQEADESEYRLISPRFTAKCDLNPTLSSEMLSGQRGTAFIYGRNISLGGYFVLQCRNWIRKKLQTATQVAS